MPEQTTIPSVKATELSAAKFMADTTCLLVDHPDQVNVIVANDDGVITLKMTVAADDISKVIGRQGRTARSLRVLLNAIANKAGIPLTLDIQAECS